MAVFYNLVVIAVSVFLKLISPFNKKIMLFVDGRKATFSVLADKIKPSDKVIWFHCASLGEFEQGRPVIEKVRKTYPHYKVVLSFFSPSGYEIRKNYDQADVVVYLPLDIKSNVETFLKLVHPEIAIIVKYEFWPNLLDGLKESKIPTLLISGIFRENQFFFKGIGSWMRNKLKTYTHFFVQDSTSKELLNSYNFTNVTVSGDTRFDRVAEIVTQNNQLQFLDIFKDNKQTLVAGSTWPDDEKLLVDFINNQANEDEKFIIAPHNINSESIQKLITDLKVKTSLYSDYHIDDLKSSQVFVVDTVGILTKIYSYADIAYVGGGFTNGIHNILEPATFGIPIVIGPKFQKFKEAKDLVNSKACLSVENKEEFEKALCLLRDNELQKEMGQKSKEYVKSNVGATVIITRFLENVIGN